jgi:hypothetical protein
MALHCDAVFIYLSDEHDRIPRRRGPLGRILGTLGTVVSVSVVTVGAMFAAAALNAVSGAVHAYTGKYMAVEQR